jgi:hypothetical protein
MQDNRRIIQMSQGMHAEGVDKTVADEDRSINPAENSEGPEDSDMLAR